MKLCISDDALRRRVMGCWLGKAIGGTLGMPYEGVRSTLNLTYYDPVPAGILPNDDLDAQVIYACLLDQMEVPRVDRHVLTKAWDHIGMSPDEYGICKRNLKLGLAPPATGSYDNPFARGMGAAIRTELWACLAPGQPDVAAAYAYEDACMDHAGEGIDAAVFLAVLESLAFVEHDRDTLLDKAIAYLPVGSELREAIENTRLWWSETRNWRIVQQQLADRYVNDNFTDVVINLAYIILGWLAGEGNFGKSICAAVNAGQDTDCTGATLGALLGILDPAGIENRWLIPIGRELVLSESVTGITHPSTLDDFTEQVLTLRRRINGSVEHIDEPPQSTDHLTICASIGFSDEDALPRLAHAPILPENVQTIDLPGHHVQWPAEKCLHRQLWVKYHMNLQNDSPVRLLFSTRRPIRVWFDGEGVLASEGAPFVPALHRAPEHQIVTLNAGAGKHEIIAVMQVPKDRSSFEWCVGLSDIKARPADNDWLIDAFERVQDPMKTH